jgi:hypothetical protein
MTCIDMTKRNTYDLANRLRIIGHSGIRREVIEVLGIDVGGASGDTENGGRSDPSYQDLKLRILIAKQIEKCL